MCASTQHLSADIRETQERVKDAFYANLFLMMAESGPREITAREIDERHEEKMLMLGPVLERLHDELLDRWSSACSASCPGGCSTPPQGVRPISSRRVHLDAAQAQKAVATGGHRALLAVRHADRPANPKPWIASLPMAPWMPMPT